jgi:hypothetical protein
MSFSWTYLTRRFLLQNYRDSVAMSIIGSYVVGSYFRKIARDDDNRWTLQRVYTHDESDIQYREVTNRTDGAIKREHAMKYAEKIKKLRADKEREAALDAFNYLNGKNLSIE